MLKCRAVFALIAAALGLLTILPQIVQPADVPMELVNNHVVIDVRLNGAGPFRFIVDSGAGNLLDPAVAAAIGVRPHGRVALMGVGAAAQSGALATVARVEIGAASFNDVHFVVAAAHSTFSAAEGPAVDGLIGTSIVGSGITVIDYPHRRVTFGAPADAVERDGATVLAVSTIDGVPHVTCTIDDIVGACALDTGSRLDVTVLAPFVNDHPAVVPRAASAPGVDGYGIGGAAFGRLGRLRQFSIGSLPLTDVVADFSVARRGAFASERTAGNIGGGILRRFAVTFDLRHSRVSLRPNDDLADRASTDRSGIFLIVRDEAISVFSVRADTAAARAGVVAGDRILCVDGKAFGPQTLPALRMLLSGPANTHLELGIASAQGVTRTIDLALGDYF